MSKFNFITGSISNFTSSVRVPVSGTQITAGSVIGGYRDLANRSSFLSRSLASVSSSIRDEFKKAYGGLFLYSANGQRVTIGPSGSNLANANFDEFKEWSNTHPVSKNVTALGNGITASINGTYRAYAQLSYRAFTNERHVFEWAFYKDGLVRTESLVRQSITSGTLVPSLDSNYKVVSLEHIMNINSGSIITLRHHCSGSDGSAQELIFHHGIMFIEKIDL